MDGIPTPTTALVFYFFPTSYGLIGLVAVGYRLSECRAKARHRKKEGAFCGVV